MKLTLYILFILNEYWNDIFVSEIMSRKFKCQNCSERCVLFLFIKYLTFLFLTVFFISVLSFPHVLLKKVRKYCYWILNLREHSLTYISAYVFRMKSSSNRNDGDMALNHQAAKRAESFELSATKTVEITAQQGDKLPQIAAALIGAFI